MKKTGLIISLGIFILLTSCAQLPKGYELKETYAYTDTSETASGKMVSDLLGNDTDKSVISLLNEGTDAFYTRLALSNMAERSIDAQYFIWHSDLVGKLLFNAMLAAADRGVRVRILLDDINIDTQTESTLYALNQHKNIEIRLYNPFASRGFRLADYIADGYRINRRMHNKSFTVDGQSTIVGGRNIGNEYFSADQDKNFHDIDIHAAGPVVAKVEKQFDTYWNSEVVIPIELFEHNEASKEDLDTLRTELAAFETGQSGSTYALDMESSEVYQRLNNITTSSQDVKLFSGDIKVIYDDPKKCQGKTEKEIVYLKSLLIPHMDMADHSLELISPYFIPGDTGTEYLTNAVKNGIKVRILTNSLSSTDGILAQSGYARHRIDLLKGGVELYELKSEAKTKASRSLRKSSKAKSGLHTKTYIFDREVVFIGSFNFDPRSHNINSEVGLICQVPEMAQVIASSTFDIEMMNNAYKVELLIEHEDVDGIDIAQEKVIWLETKDDKEIRYHVDPKTSIWRRINESLYSILPIQSQL